MTIKYLLFCFISFWLVLHIACNANQKTPNAIPIDVRQEYEKAITDAEALAKNNKCNEARQIYEVAKEILHQYKNTPESINLLKQANDKAEACQEKPTIIVKIDTVTKIKEVQNTTTVTQKEPKPIIIIKDNPSCETTYQSIINSYNEKKTDGINAEERQSITDLITPYNRFQCTAHKKEIDNILRKIQ